MAQRNGFVGAGALLLTLAGTLLWLTMLSGPARLGGGLLEARTHLSRAQRALQNGAVEKAVLETLSAEAAAGRARAGLDASSPLMDLATLSEVVSDALEETPHLVAAASHSADAARGTLEVALGALYGEDRVIVEDPGGDGSVIDIGRIEELSEVVRRVRGDVGAARDELAAIDLSHLPARVRDDITDGIDEAVETDALLDKAQEGLALLPAMLGGDGPRTYMLGFMNSAELRGSGGAMLQFQFLTVNAGKPELPDSTGGTGSIYKLDQERRRITIPLPRDAWYVREIEDAQRFGNSNWSPDWPLSARLAVAYGNKSAEICKPTRKERCPDFPTVDGVIGVDPVAVQKLVPGTGPFRIEAGNRISSGKVLGFVLSRAYSSYPIPAVRRKVLGQVVDEFFKRLFDPKDPTKLVQGFGDALATKHVQLWMSEPAEQAFVQRMRWDGALKRSGRGDYINVVQQNVGGNKLDFRATQTTAMDVELGSTDATVDTEVTIHNGIRLPQPRWVLGDSKSTHRPMVNLYVPAGAELLEADAGKLCTPTGSPLDRLCNGRVDTPAPARWSAPGTPARHSESDKTVWSATLHIPVDHHGSFRARYVVPGAVRTQGGLSIYRLVVQHQPKVAPERLLIRLHVPRGASGIRAPGFERVDDMLVFDHPLTKDIALEVAWRS